MSQTLFTPTKHEKHCPQCGEILQLKQGKKGLFFGCSAYPKCNYLQPLQTPHESKIIKPLTELCPECGQLLVLRQGHFGMFIGCSGYPHCHFIVHDTPTEQAIPKEITCPDCRQGLLVPRRGRQGKIFYGCDHYPKCKFTLPSQPFSITCPQCKCPVCVEKKAAVYQCVNKQCKHLFNHL
ncbi:DNA topoisomerase family protein [Conservatibacter flavescens]|uniref:DNA topoisomerase type IA zn finger domain-containing protein n=1 Tax=Conservatibacter flavescens TaxID=28161 RepID=A0A2M8RZL6_9PAST|nr:type I DNA topoisomerase [Conservatibacter flavescens]PJG84337.1 hypothetical protein CVP05_12060 [Conservatibacter flavescens]